MRDLLEKINSLLTVKDKIYLFLLFVVSVFVAINEILSISMVMPFFAIVSSPSLLKSNRILNLIYRAFSFKSSFQFIVTFSFILIFLMIFRAVVNTGYYYLLNKFSRTRYRTLANNLFKKYLNLSYIDFTKDSGTNLTQNMLIEANNFTQFLFGILLLMSESMIIFFMFIVLAYVNLRITVTITLALIVVAFGLITTASKVIKQAAEQREIGQNQLMRTMQETFGNFLFLKLLGKTKYFSDRFYNYSSMFIKSEAIFGMLSAIPKIFMETLGIITLLTVLLYALYLTKDPKLAIPILTMYVVVFFRLLPSINRIMTSWAQIRYYINSCYKVAKELSRHVEILGLGEVLFQKEIYLNNVSFSYDIDRPILTNFSLKINKGSHVALYGPNGSGKSTCMGLLAGLLSPVNGELLIDNVQITQENVMSWRQKIGYVPQQIYLFEGSVKDNILCGRKYNVEKLEKCCILSGVFDFATLADIDGLWVGENGIQLSGGQKQRVAFARAIYDDPYLILLDEATSAFDEKSSNEILKYFFETLRQTTIIMVTHRYEHLIYCDQVVEFG